MRRNMRFALAHQAVYKRRWAWVRNSTRLDGRMILCVCFPHRRAPSHHTTAGHVVKGKPASM